MNTNEIQKRDKMAILTSYKVTSEQRTLPEIRRELCNDKKVITPRRHISLVCMQLTTQSQNT